MPRNLESKISILLEDIQSLSKTEAIRKIEDLVTTEIEFLKKDQYFSAQDLLGLWSNAAQEMTDLDINLIKEFKSDQHTQQAYCFLSAICGILKRKGLIGFQLKYKRKSRKW